jgi:uncharacterized membrane protein YgdD (TMEM256/DUF423 family)
MDRRTLLLGATSAAIAVAAGAFGAHALRSRVAPELLAVFETGVRYQMYHALALVALGASPLPGKSLALTRWSFIAGTLLFSGSLYLLVLTGTRWWGAVTPFGGVAFIVGWCCLAFTAIRQDTA